MNIVVTTVEVVLVGSLAVIVGLLWRHRGHWFVGFEDLHQHEQEHIRKQELIVRKMERIMTETYHTIRHYVTPILQGTRAFFVHRYRQLIELERRYRQTVQLRMLSGPKKVEHITRSLEQAEKCIENEQWGEAEQKFLSVLHIEKSHTRAYEGLGEVYWNLNQWKEAMETYRFLFRRLKEKTPIGYFHRWGESAMELGNFTQAMEAFERALSMEPSHPRTLDLLTQSAILGANVDVAARALEKLKEVNPENQKIVEFEEKLQDLRASMVSKT